MKPNFIKSFKIEKSNKKKEFNFSIDNSCKDLAYRVSVLDDKNNTISFLLIQDDGGMWNLQGTNLPDWICEIELELGYAIDDSHQEFGNDLFYRN